jgi:1-acyl-sn-glycerol-3-phosphate acyltransferase
LARGAEKKDIIRRMALIIFRSALFQVAYYSHCTMWFLMAVVGWFLPQQVMLTFARWWSAGGLFLHELVVGSRVEIRGEENVVRGPALVAAKHQSAWETMAVVLFYPKPTYILKRELIWVPFFGWHLLRAGQIPINRGDRNKAMSAMAEGVRRATKHGRHILIFPEGTRRKVGAPPAYRYGVARIYESVGDVPCQPVAIISGLAWPRNTLLHYPRRIIMEFLPPIPPGLDGKVMFERMQEGIETTTNRLAAEAGYRADKADSSQSSA